MLKDELYPVHSLLQSVEAQDFGRPEDFSLCLANIIRNIRKAWATAGFSPVSEAALKRYFEFHLEGIRQLSDTFFAADRCPCNALRAKAFDELVLQLNMLIDFQRTYFYRYFDRHAVAPEAYQTSFLSEKGAAIDRATNRLSNTAIDPLLKTVVLDYFRQMVSPEYKVRFSFHGLFYLEAVLERLGDGITNEKLVRQLTALNFNHLGFFIYRQQQIRQSWNGLPLSEKLERLKEAQSALKLLPESEPAYDKQWPSLKQLLAGWLSEEAVYTAEQLRQEKKTMLALQQEKLPLNLSVAHLACLVRLFFEENLLNTSSLTVIFRFISRHYTTKRQVAISTGSLSKEFYSTSQVTAAVVRDMLLKMVARINQNFFPVLVAAGGAFCFHGGMH
ncbi:MAG: hypothetical protein JWR12_2975 [Mucilaginibacter sp.]|nr:hypothetical protein [Mucilaginibacter sp.]